MKCVHLSTTALRLTFSKLLLIKSSACQQIRVHTGKSILSVSRMIQNSLLRGNTAEMSFAFSAFALVLCHLGKHSLASLCGEVAQALVKKYHGKHSTLVACSLTVSIIAFRQPLQALISICKEAYASGMAGKSHKNVY